MFTGIIQATGRIQKNSNNLKIELLDNFFEINIGDSIAVDGICLTAKEIIDRSFTVDISEETLLKTTLGNKLSDNSIVNLEPALKISDRLGGHIVSGHVDGLGEVINIEQLNKSWLLTIKWKNKDYSKYIVNKGSICINGISLTIAEQRSNGEIFTIAIIPHTWHNTNLKYLSLGQDVNLEADPLIKYVEKLLIANQYDKFSSSKKEVDEKWMKDNGWT
tara:strand:- start:3912 stop:4568 length:657 start_codon:yes stop_codon:yes gene_type:complete